MHILFSTNGLSKISANRLFEMATIVNLRRHMLTGLIRLQAHADSMNLAATMIKLI